MGEGEYEENTIGIQSLLQHVGYPSLLISNKLSKRAQIN